MARAYDHNWQLVRLTILERDNHQCQLQYEGCTTHATHVDHIIPLSEGGARLDHANLRAACSWCNLSRNANRNTILANALTRAITTATPSRQW